MQRSGNDIICTILYPAFKNLHLNIRIFSGKHFNCASSPKKDMTGTGYASDVAELKPCYWESLLISMEDHRTPSLSFPPAQHSKECHVERVKEPFKCINTLKGIIKLCSSRLNGICLLGFFFFFYFTFLNDKSWQGVSSY